MMLWNIQEPVLTYFIGAINCRSLAFLSLLKFVFVLFYLDGWVFQYSEEAKTPVQAFCCVTVPRPRPGCLLIIGMQGKWKRAWFEFDFMPSFYHNALNNVIYIIKGVSMEIWESGCCSSAGNLAANTKYVFSIISSGQLVTQPTRFCRLNNKKIY